MSFGFETNSQLPDAGSQQFVVGPTPSLAPQPTPAIPRPDCVPVWGTEFAKLDMPGAIQLADRVIANRRPEYFVTANLNYLMLCEQFPRLRDISQHAIAVLADGHPIVARSKLSKTPLPCRVAGADMIVELAALAEQRGHRIFLLGGADGVASKAAENLVARFPSLQIAGAYAPPFRALTADEHNQLIQKIRSVRTDILLVAFGQPKGEFWIYDNLFELGVPLSIQLGASFDFLAGTARRSPKFWQRIGCEWLYRAFHDPKRLVPRYSTNAWYMFKQLGNELVGRRAST